MKPRVFVSSIMGGFEAFRMAAREGIAAAGAEAVLVEDEPSLPESPRNACLDLVASADVVIVIVGLRGGSRAPSGRLVVEEEFEEALRRGRPVLAFVQKGEVDAEAARLAAAVSDYQTGRYRNEFTSPVELRSAIVNALEPLMPTLQKMPNDPRIIQDIVAAVDSDPYGSPRLRLVCAPSAQAEIVDPVLLGRPEFANAIQEAAHRYGLFEYVYGGKRPRVTPDSLVIEEVDQEAHHARFRARLELRSVGLLIVDKGVGKGDANWSRGEGWFSDTFELLASELLSAALSLLTSLSALVDVIDPHGRYPMWIYNASLGSIGNRKIVDQASRSQSSFSSIRSDRSPLVAYDQPRLVTRVAIAEAQEEAGRIVEMLRRRLEAKGT